MGLHFEHYRQAITDVDDAGIFLSRRQEDPRARRGEEPKEGPGVFVAAVLAPEGAEHAKLDGVGLAVKAVDYEAVFPLAKGYLIQDFFGDGHDTIF